MDRVLTEFKRLNIPEESRNHPIMHVIYYITGGCKFNCSYCDVVDNNRRNTDYIKQEMIVDTISKINKPYELYIYGGEPTEYPHLDRMISYIQSKSTKSLHSIEMQTNLNITDDRIRELCSQGVQFSPSIHITFLKGDTIYDLFRKIELLESLGSLRRIDFMLEKWKVDDHLKMYEMIINSDLDLKSKLQFTNGYYEFNDNFQYKNKFNSDSRDYIDIIKKHNCTEELYELIFNDGTTEIVHKDQLTTTHRSLTRFKGWVCSSRKSQVFVDFDGDWWECNVSYKRKEPLGNVISNSEMFLKTINYPIKCRNDYCEGCYFMQRKKQ